MGDIKVLSSNMHAPIKATVRDIQAETATIQLDDQQILRVPLSAVEGNAKVGADALILIIAPGGEDAGRQAVAKHLLNELLGSPRP